MKKFPYLGFGLGLRAEHSQEILDQNPRLDWLEIITENYLVSAGKPLTLLEQIRARYPLVMHGVSLSIGSCDPLDFHYLQQVKVLAERFEPAWISDHVCWTGLDGVNTHDLLPLPYTEEAVNHVVSRIQQVQDFLGRRILIENLSSYLSYTHSEMTEWEFLSAISQAADCLILLDINNVYVSGFNHGFDPHDYLRGIPSDRVQQIHLAGHVSYHNYILDTHDAPVVQPVWDLYRIAVQQFGEVSTMIERDDNIPSLVDLMDEVEYARRIAMEVTVSHINE